MCEIITTLFTALGAGGAATAAGSTAGAAASMAGTLKGIGTALAIAGPVVQGVQAASAARQNVALIEEQKKQQAVLGATKAERERQIFASQIAQQRAELAARGVSLDSPTAIFLGQTAAREMSFNTQAIRSGSQAQVQQLSAEQASWRSRGRQAVLRGGLSAAGAWLNKEPDEWMELLS